MMHSNEGAMFGAGAGVGSNVSRIHKPHGKLTQGKPSACDSSE